jgi:hypothetical protein
MRTLIDAVHARPVGESPWTMLTNAAAEVFSQLVEPDPEWVAKGRLVRTQPALVAAQVQTFAALERELEAEVAARMPDPFPVRARLTAATFLAALRVSMQIWLDQPPGTSLWSVVEESLAEAGAGFR